MNGVKGTRQVNGVYLIKSGTSTDTSDPHTVIHLLLSLRCREPAHHPPPWE